MELLGTDAAKILFEINVGITTQYSFNSKEVDYDVVHRKSLENKLRFQHVFEKNNKRFANFKLGVARA